MIRHSAGAVKYRSAVCLIFNRRLPRAEPAWGTDKRWHAGKIAQCQIRRWLLARGLTEKAYDHNSGFRTFIDKCELSFKSHSEFKKVDLEVGQELYRHLAEQIWNPDSLVSGQYHDWLVGDGK